MSAGDKRVPARYFTLLLDELRAQGQDIARLLQLAGIDDADLRRAEARLTLAQIDALVAAGRRLSGRTDLGFEMGALIKMTSHDILGYGMIGSRSVDQMLRLASRYYHLMNELFTLRYRREADVGEALYSPVTAMPPQMLHFVLEALAVAHHKQMQLLLGAALRPYDIVLGMPTPAHYARYASLAPARVRFDAQTMPGVRVRMRAQMLDHALPLASQAVVEQVIERCEALTRRPTPDGGGWGTFVTMMLSEAHGERLTMEDIARRLQVSVRSVERNLKKEGLQFRDLAQRVLMVRARDLLDEPGATVAQVAERLGFSDAANFSRAFRRCTGRSPMHDQRSAVESPLPAEDSAGTAAIRPADAAPSAAPDAPPGAAA